MPRNNVPLFVMMPPDERERLKDFADRIARPYSWVVRDAVRVYLDAVEGDAGRVEALRAPTVDAATLGRTKAAKRGRPPKGANVR